VQELSVCAPLAGKELECAKECRACSSWNACFACFAYLMPHVHGTTERARVLWRGRVH
jgi:hypothetical protein